MSLSTTRSKTLPRWSRSIPQRRSFRFAPQGQAAAELSSAAEGIFVMWKVHAVATLRT